LIGKREREKNKISKCVLEVGPFGITWGGGRVKCRPKRFLLKKNRLGNSTR
jgi:hypothetical protein